MNVHTKARVLAADAVVTGSIVKIYAPAAAELTDCKFGNFVDAGDNFSLASSSIHQANGTAIAIPVGTYLEGPFAAIHMSNDSVTVVYYNGELKVE